MCTPAPGDRIPTPGATTRDQLARSLYSSLLPSAAALPTRDTATVAQPKGNQNSAVPVYDHHDYA